MKTVLKDYGTNNEKAFTDACPQGGKHFWGAGKNLGKCYELNVCAKC